MWELESVYTTQSGGKQCHFLGSRKRLHIWFFFFGEEPATWSLDDSRLATDT
jgi:hypothetical protein